MNSHRCVKEPRSGGGGHVDQDDHHQHHHHRVSAPDTVNLFVDSTVSPIRMLALQGVRGWGWPALMPAMPVTN